MLPVLVLIIIINNKERMIMGSDYTIELEEIRKVKNDMLGPYDIVLRGW